MREWNVSQYNKFKDERIQPSVDLIKRIDTVPETILDIGCGPGNSTYCLKEHFPLADILGIDSSDNMLESAEKTYPELKFVKCLVPDEIESLGNYDLIFSNACLHWIPNHDILLPRLFGKLSRNGVLAVQMPLIEETMFYHVLDSFISCEKWGKLSNVRVFNLLTPDETYDILSKFASEIEMWETTYYHILSSHDDILEWYKGSGLRAYLEVLNGEDKKDFLSEFSEFIKEKYPLREDGKILLKVPRFFFIVKNGR